MENDNRPRTATLAVTLDPKDTNLYGNIFGGVIMSLIDKAAAVAAWRYARQRVVTAAAHRIAFHTPMQVGEVAHAVATVVYVGRTSMDVEVRVEAEDVLAGERRLAASGLLTMVAVDETWRPASIPRWEPETDDEKRQWQEALAIRQCNLRNV